MNVDRLLWHPVELHVVLDLSEPLSPDSASWLAAPARITPRKGGVTLQVGGVRKMFSTSAAAFAHLNEMASVRRSVAKRVGEDTATGLYHLDCAAKYMALRNVLMVRAHRLWPGEVGLA